MKQFVLNISLNYPKWVFLAFAVIVISLGTMIPSIKVDVDPENMLPTDEPDRVAHNEIKDRFNIYDLIALGVVNEKAGTGIYNPLTLAKIHKLNKGIEKIEGVIRQDIMSLPSAVNIFQEGVGAIRYEWMMNSPPTTQAEADAIKSAVERLPLQQNTLVSEDHKAAAIYIPVIAKSESYRISQEIEALIGELGTDDNGDQFYYTGIPVAQDTFGKEMFDEMAIAVPVTSLLIFFVMWLFFRSVILVSAPMLMAHGVVIATMGMLIGTGNTVTIMSSLIPIFLLPITIVDSIHILSEFCDRYTKGDDVRAVIKRTVNELYRPMLFTSLTTAVGFSSLVFAPIPPVKAFGLFVAFGILVAFVFTITVIPAYIVSMKEKSLEKLVDALRRKGKSSLVTIVLRSFGAWATGAPRIILVMTVGILSLSVFGIYKIEINDSAVNQFAPGHKMRIADKALNEHFPGTNNAFLVLNKQEPKTEEVAYWKKADRLVANRGNHDDKNAWLELKKNVEGKTFNERLNITLTAIVDLVDNRDSTPDTLWSELIDLTEQSISSTNYFTKPEAVSYLAGLQRGLRDSGTVGKVNGLPDLIKTVSRELNGGTEDQFTIPGSQAGIAQTLISFQGSHRPHDLWHMVTPDYRSSMLWLQLPDGANMEMEKVLAYVDGYIEDNPLPKDVSIEWGGLTHLYVTWQHAMVDGMLESLMVAYVVVFVLMVVLFRSIVFGFLALIPVTLTIVFIYGIIGLTGKSYDTPIAILSSLVLGLTVDYSIHFLERARALYEEIGDWRKTMGAMFEEPARAITRNAIVIAIGFSPLVFSLLTPYITVGKFLAAVMIVSCIFTLLVFPPLLMNLPQRLLKKINENDQEPESVLEGGQP